MEGRLIEFTAQVMNNLFLEEPIKVFLRCDVAYQPFNNIVRYTPTVGGHFHPLCLSEPCKPNEQPVVVGSLVKNVSVMSISYGNDVLSSKYFTPALFRKYIQQACCSCEPVCEYDFLLANGCVLELNDCGLIF